MSREYLPHLSYDANFIIPVKFMIEEQHIHNAVKCPCLPMMKRAEMIDFQEFNVRGSTGGGTVSLLGLRFSQHGLMSSIQYREREF